MWFYKRKGFTLLELMIVVVIIGILATLALPRFFKAADRARWAAAASMLATIRSAQLRYYAEYSLYDISAIVAGGGGNLDVEFTFDTAKYSLEAANDTAGSTYIGRVTNLTLPAAATLYRVHVTAAGVISPVEP